jgi:hypothetical protein
MSHAINRLSASTVKSAPVGKHADGGGLWLVKRPDGGAQWVQRVTPHGRRREMGLGAYPDVSLKEARDAATHNRALPTPASQRNAMTACCGAPTSYAWRWAAKQAPQTG